jgi:hypothetical protein
VFVIDSRKDTRAASAGGILLTRLMRRGVAGIVTDGGFRDSPEIAEMAMPAYHSRPSAPTNISLAAGLIVGSIALGFAWAEGRYVLARLLIVAMLAVACAFAAFATLLSRPVKAPAGAPPLDAH